MRNSVPRLRRSGRDKTSHGMVTGAASLLLAAVLASCALEPDAYDPGKDAGIDVTLVPLNVIGGVGAVPVEPGGEMQQLGFAAAVAARAGSPSTAPMAASTPAAR